MNPIFQGGTSRLSLSKDVICKKIKVLISRKYDAMLGASVKHVGGT